MRIYPVDKCTRKAGEINISTGKAYINCIKKYCPELESVRHGENPNIGLRKEKKEILINEAAVLKIEKTLDKTADVLNSSLDKPLDYTEEKIEKIPVIHQLKELSTSDPTKNSASKNAKEWAALMGGGSLAMHAPMMIADPSSIPLNLGIAVGNAAKGAVIGPLLSGGKDTLLKSTMIPMGVAAVMTPMLNRVGEHFGYDEIDFMPEARVGLLGALGAGTWWLRNRKKENRNWI